MQVTLSNKIGGESSYSHLSYGHSDVVIIDCII